MTVTLSGGHQKEIKLSRYIGSGALVVPAGGTGWRENASAGASISSCHDEVNALSVEGGGGGGVGVGWEWGVGWGWGGSGGVGWKWVGGVGVGWEWGGGVEVEVVGWGWEWEEDVATLRKIIHHSWQFSL